MTLETTEQRVRLERAFSSTKGAGRQWRGTEGCQARGIGRSHQLHSGTILRRDKLVTEVQESPNCGWNRRHWREGEAEGSGRPQGGRVGRL